MDLGGYGIVTASEAGADLLLRSPQTGDEITPPIHVLGGDAEAVLQAGRAFDRAKSRRPEGEDAPDDTAERRRLAIVAVAVTDWRGHGIGAEALTPQNAARLLADRDHSWIVDQVFRFMAQRRHFTPAASPD